MYFSYSNAVYINGLKWFPNKRKQDIKKKIKTPIKVYWENERTWYVERRKDRKGWERRETSFLYFIQLIFSG